MKPGEPADGRPFAHPGADVIAVVDTGSWPQLAEMKPVLEGQAHRTVLIDHHAHGDESVSSTRFIDSRAASCTQVLAPLCADILGLSSPARLPTDIAAPLYLGLATDTGWFRYDSVRPETLRLAGDLIEAGVKHTDLYRMIEQQDTLSRWRLFGRALASIELHDLAKPCGKLSLMTLSLADFDGADADRTDTGGFADMLLTVAEVGASALLTEGEVGPNDPPLTKVSLRSKPGPTPLDVGTLTKSLGGGGHFLAAGLKLRLSIPEAKRVLLEAARAQ